MSTPEKSQLLKKSAPDKVSAGLMRRGCRVHNSLVNFCVPSLFFFSKTRRFFSFLCVPLRSTTACLILSSSSSSSSFSLFFFFSFSLTSDRPDGHQGGLWRALCSVDQRCLFLFSRCVVSAMIPSDVVSTAVPMDGCARRCVEHAGQLSTMLGVALSRGEIWNYTVDLCFASRRG